MKSNEQVYWEATHCYTHMFNQCRAKSDYQTIKLQHVKLPNDDPPQIMPTLPRRQTYI